MKIFELITPQMAEKQPIITSHKNCGSYLTYSKKINTWIWCDVYGKALEYEGDLVRVVLSKEILEDDTWFIYSDRKDENWKTRELLKELKKKNKERKTFIESKMEEYNKEWNELFDFRFTEVMGNLMKLSKAQSIGLILYCLNDEKCSKEDMKKIINENIKDDIELRSMCYSIYGDIESDLKRE